MEMVEKVFRKWSSWELPRYEMITTRQTFSDVQDLLYGKRDKFRDIVQAYLEAFTHIKLHFGCPTHTNSENNVPNFTIR